MVPVPQCLLSGLIFLLTPVKAGVKKLFCEEGWGKTREEKIQ